MTYLSRSFVLFVVVVLITALVPIFGCPSPGQGQNNLASRVDALEAALATTQADLATTQAELAVAQAKLAHVRVQQGTINGVNGPHLIVEGCNVHVRSGSGDTEDSGGLTGLGNLVVGYNELPPTAILHGRLGSHNLVVGTEHQYSSYVGFVAGISNATTGPVASVSGGQSNEAGGIASSVSGGTGNAANGIASSVSGGSVNEANGLTSSVSGGVSNEANGASSSVSGGIFNTASSETSSVSGGSENEASGDGSSVSGGQLNEASGAHASVSGGNSRAAGALDDWAAGSLFEDN